MTPLTEQQLRVIIDAVVHRLYRRQADEPIKLGPCGPAIQLLSDSAEIACWLDDLRAGGLVQ